MSTAGADQILVSEIVRAFAATAGLAFEDRGEHRLKGLSGPRRLFALADDQTRSRLSAVRR